MQVPGEASITPQAMQQVTPDVLSTSGKQQLFAHLAKATIEKPDLDTVLQAIAKRVDGEFNSRVKNAQTVVQKIAQKRLQGRDYTVSDINDPYGGRIIVKDQKNIQKAVREIKEMATLGAFKILKNEEVTKDTYHARHIDLQTPQGGRAEVQLMEPDEHLESVANHGLRAVFGEKPPDKVSRLKEKQAGLAKKIADRKAIDKATSIQALSQNNQIPNPQTVANIMQST